MNRQTPKLRQFLPRALSRRLPRRIIVVQISTAESSNLNHRFFKKYGSANVLSFRYGPDYGEILICPEVIRREAQEQRNTYKYQLAWMIIHGMIHLAGRHHEKSRATARKVVRLERIVLRKLSTRKLIK